MTQIFHPSTNTLSRLTIFGAVFMVLGLLSLSYMINQSPYVTEVAVIKDQPVQFSHEHHVKGLGLDCRYCHTSVETEAQAGMPPTYTCMTCHSQVWKDAPILAPVRQSLADDKPIHWEKVHDLPDYAYFHHGIHVSKGIGCVTCHGQVDQMPLMWKAEPMTMQWCLDCHRNPEKHLRPLDKVFDFSWTAASEGKSQEELGRELLEERHIPIDRMTNCSVCHR